MGPLQVSLLWALLFVVGEYIVTQPGSELLLPVTQRLTLHPPNCDRYEWIYKGIKGENLIANNRRCELTQPDSVRFPNMKISENGSLIISPVTAENTGTYIVRLSSGATGRNIGTYTYRLDVEEYIVTVPGSELLLPITQQLTLHPPNCDRYDWRYEGIKGETLLASNNRRCEPIPPDSVRFPNMKISENGNLIISPVTAENPGTYTVRLISAAERYIPPYTYKLHLEAPVSPPVLDILCLRDGRAQVSCRVDDGSHYTIYLNVTGPSEGGYSSLSNNITVTVPTSDPWSVTCTAENRVSRRNVTQTRAACPVSLSGIALNSSCLPDGSAEAVCWIVNGSDPRFSWSLDGESQLGRSSSSSSRVTLPPPVSGILRCNVTNNNSLLTDSKNITCTVPVSVPDITRTCLSNGSAEISCEVQNGTDLALILTINGSSEVYNTTSLQRRVSVTVPSMLLPSNVACSVRNSISNRSATMTAETCARPCYTCLQKSVIGLSVVLLAVSPFYVFAYWYTLRDMKKEN